MPFGLVFGAVVFSILGLWFGFGSLFSDDLAARATGVVVIVLGASLGLGLMRRQPLARWTGLGASAFLAVVGGANVVGHGGVGDHVILLASLATFVLLAIPATGDVRRGLEGSAAKPPRRGRVLGVTALVSLTLLMAVYGWTRLTQETSAGVITATGHTVDWNDYGPGLTRAKTENRLVLVDFYADWCQPCKVMDRETFTDRRVVEALRDLVPVRVDSEETRPRDGFVGAELAERYGVTGYPTLMLLNGDGEVVAKQFGMQTPSQLLAWIDEVRDRKSPGVRP
ncbi:MAG: thioredoxin family protein [Acidobacteriota bacterium]|nr:thioredoxin family protein [Acidobacteriota bacterium]